MKADRFVIRQKLLIALASFSSASARDWSCRAASAQAKPLSRTWPGIATRLGAEAVGSAGIVGSVKKWIYRVDCGELYYDLQGSGNPSLAVGQDVTF